MQNIIVFTKEEYDNLLLKFIDAWMKYQNKTFGNTVISNETERKITDKNTLCGAFLLPWKEVFKLGIPRNNRKLYE